MGRDRFCSHRRFSKFVNDTPYWLLMETYMHGYNLTWKFYSTSGMGAVLNGTRPAPPTL